MKTYILNGFAVKVTKGQQKTIEHFNAHIALATNEYLTNQNPDNWEKLEGWREERRAYLYEIYKTAWIAGKAVSIESIEKV